MCYSPNSRHIISGIPLYNLSENDLYTYTIYLFIQSFTIVTGLHPK